MHAKRAGDLFDLIVIGGGTAGLVAAAGAASLGARSVLIERQRLGGECLWSGCVPSKALIGSARIADALRRTAEFGLSSSEAGAPASEQPGRAPGTGPFGSAVLASVRETRARVQPHDDPSRFRELSVEVLEGTAARLVSPVRVEAGDRVLEGRRILIATGSRPAIPPVEGLAEAGCYTHETAFEDDSLPRSVVVLGAGPIGVEFAQAYCRLGVEVTLVELADRILPNEDAEVAAQLESLLRREGIRIHVGHAAISAERSNGESVLHLKSMNAAASDVSADPTEAAATATVRAERIFVAAGRLANVEGLGLEAAGVDVGRDGIAVDRTLRTSRRHIYAAGDVTGGLRFTHVADHEARAVVRNALFPLAARVDYSVVPWAVFSDPPLARVGLTEAEARERHGDAVRVYRYDTSDLDRVITDRETGGMVKLITDRRGRLLGGHVLAPSAGTMIVEVAMAIRHRLRIADLSKLVHPYPTMSEGIRRAADMYYRSKLTDRSRRWLDRYFRATRRLGGA